MQKIEVIPSNKELRVFALIITSGFLIFGWGIPFYKNHQSNIYLLLISGIIFFLGVFLPKTLIWPRKYWLKTGHILGVINTTILFSIIYFIIFSSIGLIFRCFGRDRLCSKFREVKSTMVVKGRISSFSEPF